MRMWDAVNGKQMGEPFRGHSVSVEFVGFTEESGVIISGSPDGTICRWSKAPSKRITESTERREGQVEKFCLLTTDGRPSPAIKTVHCFNGMQKTACQSGKQ